MTAPKLTSYAAALLLSLPPLPGMAQDSGRITVELNNASDTETGACRLTFVATNRSGTGFDAAAWQVGVFDAQGVVRSLLVLEFGALAEDRTRIVLFDLPGRPCGDISRVVVNDVTACRTADGGSSPLCLDALDARSRTDIAFGL